MRTEKEIRLKRLELLQARDILMEFIEKDLAKKKEPEPDPVKWARHYLSAALEAIDFALGESSAQIINQAITGCELYLRKSRGGNIEYARSYLEKRKKLRNKILEEERDQLQRQIKKDFEELLEIDWDEFEPQQ